MGWLSQLVTHSRGCCKANHSGVCAVWSVCCVECVLCGVCAGVTASNDDKCSAAGLTARLLYRPSVSNADTAGKHVSRSRIIFLGIVYHFKCQIIGFIL